MCAITIMKLLALILCTSVINCLGLVESYDTIRIPEDGRLNFTELARKHGHVAEEYDLITPDGYIIQVNHIVGDPRKPILLIHGAIVASDSFILRGETSLGIILARQGYDVWAINTRGSRYSRRHLTLNPDVDKEYWDFSIHEHGYYDTPLVIDFVLVVTGQKTLKVIGFSEGTAIMYLLGAERPEYNDKISIFISLAPVHILQNTRPYMSAVIQNSPLIYDVLVITQNDEFMGFYSPFKQFWDVLCTQNVTGFQLCLVDFLYQLSGVDIEEIEEDFFRVIVGHFPAGSSSKTMYHLGQTGITKVFGQFDYGPKKNELVYGSRSPPKYDLRKVTMRVALFVGLNDRISTVEDVALLRRELPNVVHYHEVERPQFNHLDFIWGRNTHRTLYPHVLETLERYG